MNCGWMRQRVVHRHFTAREADPVDGTTRIPAALPERNKENVRGGSLSAMRTRIQAAGLDIHADFIVGFSSDDKGAFEDQF